MNACFYMAIARLPLGTVGAIEFLGPIALAVVGARSRRNAGALALAVAGVWLLTDVRLVGQPLSFAFAFANCALRALCGARPPHRRGWRERGRRSAWRRPAHRAG